MRTQKQTYKPEEMYPIRRVWVVEEARLGAEEPAEEEFGYNDWDIYHGA